MLSFDDFSSLFAGRTFAQLYGFTRDHARELAGKGCDLLEAGAPDQAVTVFEGLVVINHQDSGNWCSLGVAYLEAGRAQDARAALETALRLQPANGVAAKHLARAKA
jgi:Flp pilus assembly protein TadD